MKKILIFLVFAASLSALHWHADFEAAKELASCENKPLFILFSGSDWCESCKKLETEILDKAVFKRIVEDKFVFVLIDFPLHHGLGAEAVTAASSLKEQFHVDGFPTVVILMPSGDHVTLAGNFPNEATACAEFFLKEVDAIVETQTALCSNDLSVFSQDELEYLYQQSVRMGHDTSSLVQVGCKKKIPSFLRARYRHLAEDGEETKEIKDQLSTQEDRLFLALSDFQLSLKKGEEPSSCIKPILGYLKEFASIDSNAWRLELMIAQFLNSMGEREKALEFAKAAYSKAPEVEKATVQKVISSIQS